MNRWGGYHQQKALMRGCVVACPKPRRIGAPFEFHEALRHSSGLLYFNQPTEACGARAGTELLDIIRMKGSSSSERSGVQVSSSPPFFSGTPPSRVSNPLTQDEKFGNINDYSFSPIHGSPSSARRTGGCAEANFSSKPTVRIEGFQCCGDSRISAIA